MRCIVWSLAVFICVAFDTAGDAAVLVTHYSADNVSVNADNRVTSWLDGSGNNNYAGLAGGAGQATRLASGIGGLPSIQFDAYQGYASVLNMGSSFTIQGDAPWTQVWVFRQTGTLGWQDHVGGIGYAGGSPGAALLEIEYPNLDIAGGWYQDVRLTGYDAIYAQDLIVTVTHSGGGSFFSTTDIFVNGYAPGEGILSGSTKQDLAGGGALNLWDFPVSLGYNPSNGIAHGFQGLMSEFLIYQGALSESERQSLETSLGAKYGISVNPVPEPSALTNWLLLASVTGCAVWLRRRKA